MRPHRLRVTAFGAFAATEQVVFDDLEGLFLLHGETGAGKTTLLDAIAFALYGRVPGERGTARRLRSDHAAPGTATEVELEATIGGRRLRITRRPEQERPKRSGAGITREPASVRLDELSASGSWESKSTRIGEADGEIENLMGMSAAQFFQVVLLPQGEFAKFLRADAKDKEALLRKLFGTDRFRQAETWLADRRLAVGKDVAAAEGVVNRLVAQLAQAAGAPVPDEAPDVARAAPVPGEAPDAAAWAAGLVVRGSADRDAAAALVALRKAELEAALAARSQAEQLADRQRRRRDAIGRQQDLESAAPSVAALRAEADAASRAAEVIPVLDAAATAATAAADAGSAETRARAAIPADFPSPADASPETLRTAAGEQHDHLVRLDALRAVARQAAEEDANAAGARARAATFGAEAESRESEVCRRQDSRPDALGAREAASRAAAAAPSARSRAEAARRVAVDSAALLDDQGTYDRLREGHVNAREQAVGLREDANRLHQLRVDGMSAELAATLFDGHECPVCGSLEHPNPKEPTFEPVSREQEAAAGELADKADRAAASAGQEAAAAKAVIDDILERLAAAGFSVPASSAGPVSSGPVPSVRPAQGAARIDVAALVTAAAQAQAEAEELETEAALVSAQASGLAEAQQRLDELDQAIAADKARLVELTGQCAAALSEAEAADQRAARHRSEILAGLGDAPDLEEAVSATSVLAEALAQAADTADETARSAALAHDAAVRAARAATDAGFPAVEDAQSAFRDASWRGEAAARVRHHEAETEAVASLLADPDLASVPLDPPAPVAEAGEAAEAAQQAHAAAVDAYGEERHRAEQLGSLQPQLEAAISALQPLKDRVSQIRQLADLANGTSNANQYKMTLSSFVLAARLEEVAAAASERLLTMTAGRYSLVHSDARKGNAKAGLSLLACDSWTGIDRDTATLSGGETFLASLALALGLADVVTAESAGTPMEALFVDEGFGTLDEETLDEVMNVLDGLRAGGRIVGIVSHVSELRQRVPAQVRVRKSRTGSHVEVTAG
jgi:DNA repair protein SbcC/Rad50